MNRILRLKGSTTVTTAATTLAWGSDDVEYIDLEPHRVRQLSLLLKVATQNLATLKIYGLSHRDETQWVPIADAATDFTGGDNKYVKDAQVYSSADVLQDADLNTIEATQYGWLVLALPGFSRLKIVCTASTTGAVVTATATGYPGDVNLGAVNISVHSTVRNDVGLLNKAEAEIDPATEDKQDDLIQGVGPTTAALIIAGNEGSLGSKLRRLNVDLDALLTLLAVGTGVMTSAQAVTLATNDTQFGQVGAAADPDGNVHGQLRSIAEAIDTLEALLAVGTGSMASAQAVTVADDDTQFGAVGAAADPDGNIHGQLRTIAEAVDTLETLLAVGSGAMASAQAVTLAIDDTVVGATDAAVAAAGGVGSLSAKLRKISADLGTIDTDTGVLATAKGTGLTFSTVAISQGTTPARLSIGQLASNHVRLHALIGTLHAQGNLKIACDTDGAGASETVLSGDMDLATDGGVVIPFTADPNGCLKTDTLSDHLTIISSTGAFNGYAVISTATS